MTDISYINKSISNEIRKWIRFNADIFLINDLIFYCYKNLITGNLDSKKDNFKRIHFLKIKKYYIYLKIYHDNIKKTLANEKLLKHFESVLVANGFKLV